MSGSNPGADGLGIAGPVAWMAWFSLVSAGAAAFLWPAIDNGYPLAFQDSNWHLRPVFGEMPHYGRSIGYSVFARFVIPVSAGATLWTLVIAQSFVTSALVVGGCIAAARDFAQGLRLGAFSLGVLLLLSGCAKYVSWLMADVMTSWLFLAGLLWMLSRGRGARLLAVVVFALAVVGHNTHPPLAIASAATVAVGAALFPGIGRGARRAAFGMLGIALLSLPWALAVNTVAGPKASVLQGADSFLVNRFLQTGVLLETLDTYCSERDWKSCRHREEFAQTDGQSSFFFDRSSPFFTALHGWRGVEQAELVEHAFRCCSVKIATTTLAGAWQQFWSVQSDYGLASRDSKPLRSLLRRHVPEEVPVLEASRQYQDGARVMLHSFPEVPLQVILLILGAGLAAFGWQRGERRATLLLAALVAFLIANALVCSLASNAYPRYQGRIAWLLPYCLTLVTGWVWRRPPSAKVRVG